MKNSYTEKEQYYGDYLALDKILNAQHLESVAQGVDAHDEMLFIIIHQTYELWFKQIMHEVGSVMKFFREDKINDNSGALQTSTHRLNRVVEILKILVEQMRVMETMTAMDFLDFRDLLTPASGFQSYQFRILEATLGLRMAERHQASYYQHQLCPAHIEVIQEAETATSLFELVDTWLARMPFWDVDKYWKNFEHPATKNSEMHPFWANYRYVYEQGLQGEELKGTALVDFDQLFFNANPAERTVRLSAASCQAALLINVYREYPLLQLPFRFLTQLLDIDALMALWRQKHVSMVRRMIGFRAGTGGSTGADYLQGAMNKHYIFNDFARLATYLVPRTKRPILPAELERKLGFSDL